jgi:micrococcal nuclease
MTTKQRLENVKPELAGPRLVGKQAKRRPRWVVAAVALIAAGLGLVAMGQAAGTPKLPVFQAPNFSKLTICPVVRVIDGDTIVVQGDANAQVTVRLIGVDTPETVHPTKPVEEYGKEASRFTGNLLKGEKVYLAYEGQNPALDKYGRTLAYIYRAPDGLFVNAELIRQGYAHAYIAYPFRYLEQFRQLEQFARQAEKGLWGTNAGGTGNRATGPRICSCPTSAEGCAHSQAPDG